MIILIVICVLGIIAFVFASLYFTKGWFKWFYHDIMGWHVPSNKLGWNGVSLTSVCKHCGEEIMQDSQGNWF